MTPGGLAKRWRQAVVVIVAIVAGVQIAAVTVASLPPTRTVDPVRPATDYLFPFFRQDWRLFAPNPISEDRNLLAQPAWRRADGTIEEGEWVDLSAIDLDLIRHRPIGGRAGYATNRLAISVDETWNALPEEQQVAVDRFTPESPATPAAVRGALGDAGTLPGLVTPLLANEQAAVTLATDLFRGRADGRTLVAVRYGVTIRPVLNFDQRDLPASQRVAATRREGFWWAPVADDPQRRAVLTDFDERHR